MSIRRIRLSVFLSTLAVALCCLNFQRMNTAKIEAVSALAKSAQVKEQRNINGASFDPSVNSLPQASEVIKQLGKPDLQIRKIRRWTGSTFHAIGHIEDPPFWQWALVRASNKQHKLWTLLTEFPAEQWIYKESSDSYSHNLQWFIVSQNGLVLEANSVSISKHDFAERWQDFFFISE